MSVTTQNQDQQVLDINWDFWDAQLDTFDALASDDYDLVVFRGGYGSGKTVLGVRWIIEQALTVPHSDNLILAPNLAKGGPTTFKTFFRELPGERTIPDEGGDPENSPAVATYHATKRRTTFITGSVVRLGSGDEWNRYAGGEFNSIHADEVAHYEQTDRHRLLEMLTSRQRTEDGPNVMLWTSTGNGYDEFHDIVERQIGKDGEPLPTRIKSIVADSRDNPFLPESEKLAQQFEGTAREEEVLAGGFAAAQGLVYSSFSREHHVIPEPRADELAASDTRLFGYDSGWNDPRVVLELAPTDYGQWIVIDRFYETESQPEDIIDYRTGEGWLADKPKGPLYCEHEPTHIQKFRRAGWPATETAKDLDEGIAHVRGRLQLDDEGKPGLLVSDRCVELIQELMSYKREHVGKAVAEDHCCDALMYALFSHEGKPKQSRREKADDYSGIHSF